MEQALCPAVAILVPGVAGCVRAEPSHYRAALDKLGDSTSRRQLCALLPPIDPPKTNPILLTRHGASGYESYVVSDQQDISYSVRYRTTPAEATYLFVDRLQDAGPARIIASPLDEVSGFALRPRHKSHSLPDTNP